MYRIRTAPAVPYGAVPNITNGKPPLPSFYPHPSSASSRFSNHVSTPEAAACREEHQDSYNNRPYVTSYHDAVRFTGGSRSSKVPAVHLEGSELHNALYGSAGCELGSIKGLDGTQTSQGGDTRMDSVCRCAAILACLLSGVA